MIEKEGVIFIRQRSHTCHPDQVPLSGTRGGISFNYHLVEGDSSAPSWRIGMTPLKQTLRTIGNLLIFFSLLGFFATLAPTLFYEASFRLKQIRGIEYGITNVHLGGVHSATSEVTGTNSKQKALVPKDTSFNILIPKLGVNEKVFANVDPSNENEYSSILRKGAAHAKGTYFPGQDGNIYIFAHSGENFWDGVRFNNIFYLLKDLQPKDEIVIFFNNKRYNYIVDKSEITNPSKTSFITSAKTGEEQLILQTCWPPLTTWNRLLVFAKPI